MKKEKRMLLIQPTIYDNNHLLVKKDKLYFIGFQIVYKFIVSLLVSFLPVRWSQRVE